MGVTTTQATMYTCDADGCDVAHSVTASTRPKGLILRIDAVTLGTLDGAGRIIDGMEDAGQVYACGVKHVRSAVATVMAQVAALLSGEDSPELEAGDDQTDDTDADDADADEPDGEQAEDDDWSASMADDEPVGAGSPV